MKAIVCTQYGGPNMLQFSEVTRPIPKDNEVLIKINAASVTTADCMMRTGKPLIGRLFIGLKKPKYPITGTGFAGEVESIGKDVTQFNKGDLLFGESIFGAGTHAEYVCVSEEGVIAIKPNNMTFEEAAPICDGALTSLSFLKDVANIKPGQRVLINGASGSLGSAAVQIAQYFGTEVTAVCSGKNAALVKSLGATTVINYNHQDFTKTDQTYDIIFDTIGKSSFSQCKASLTKNGIYLSSVFGISNLLQMLWTSKVGSKKAKFSATGMRPVAELRALLDELKILIEEKKIKSVIDKSYSLKETAEAHQYIDKGHKIGNVVISMKCA